VQIRPECAPCGPDRLAPTRCAGQPRESPRPRPGEGYLGGAVAWHFPRELGPSSDERARAPAARRAVGGILLAAWPWRKAAKPDCAAGADRMPCDRRRPPAHPSPLITMRWIETTRSAAKPSFFGGLSCSRRIAFSFCPT